MDEIWTLDFEASGITENGEGYPIEVGFTNGHFTKSLLIKPLKHWTHWDWYAEKAIHRISRDVLNREGNYPIYICKQLNHYLKGQTVYCDGGHNDKFWLNRLFDDSNVEVEFTLVNYVLINPLNKKTVAHRALPDAMELWKAIVNERKELNENK